MSFWTQKRVVVTGGAGFLGSVVVEKLREGGCQNVTVPQSSEYDLRDREAIVRLYKQTQPNIVVHLAAVVAASAPIEGIPRAFYDNAIMGIQIMEYARVAEVQKFICHWG